MNSDTRRRAKIVATMGPACKDRRAVDRLVEAGVDVFRLNFSHGTHEGHERALTLAREAAEEAGRPVAVMQDLQGPRLRTGPLKTPTGVELEEGDELTIIPGEFEGTAEAVSTSYPELPQDVSAGQSILLGDGMIELEVEDVAEQEVRCRVQFGGVLGEHEGMNLPGLTLSITSPTDKDLEDLQFAVEHEVDYVALSFVQSAEDVACLNDEIADRGEDIPVIAKIEKPEALDHLDDILGEADGAMVARGDLGIEMQTEAVPPAQKRIIRRANTGNKPVITATQMLESMMEHPRPTRAEASDVANAVLDGTDAVMLSGETAVGRYPGLVVDTMRRITEHAEDLLRDESFAAQPPEPLPANPRETTLAMAARDVAERLDAAGIVAFTMTGATARHVSQRRPDIPIYALSPSETTCRRLALVWGVRPVRLPVYSTTDDMIRHGDARLQELGLVREGQTIVCMAGGSTGTRGGTDMLKVHAIGEAD